MTTCIVLLRGINVSGKKKIKMDALRSWLTEAGLQGVRSYIQSGNLLCDSTKTAEQVRELVHNTILKHSTFEVPVWAFTLEKLNAILAQNPFPQDKVLEPKAFYYALFDAPVDSAIASELHTIECAPEAFEIVEDVLYFYTPTGYGKTKFHNNFFERKTKRSATSRNHKTMTALQQLACEK